MTFFISGNLQPVNNAQTMWMFKNLLVQAGYVVVSSSNGSALQAGDMHTTFSSLAITNAYFIIKQPLGATGSHGGWRREWGIQRGTSNVAWRVSYTVDTEHANGGTASTMPSGSNRKWILENQATWQAGSTGLFFEGDSTNFIFIGVDNAPPHGWYLISQPVSNPAGSSFASVVNPYSALLFDPLASGSFHPDDQDPVVQYSVLSAATALLATGPIQNYLSGNVASTRAWMGLNISSGTFTATPAIVPFTNGTSANLIGNATKNFFSNKDDVFPVYYIKPTFGTTNFIPLGGIKGVSSLMSWKLIPRETMSTLNISSSRDRIVFGDLVFPWDNTIPNK